jgi:UDP-N-acetylmuramoyl-tripeptide--D-alanyl-D-alanine ligase
VAGRLQVKQARSGALIIDDSYNANPSSMEAAIEVLSGLTLSGPRWLVIGDMGEMGDHGPAAHTAIGEFARARGIGRVYATGPLSRLAVASFGAQARWLPDTTTLAQALLEDIEAAHPPEELRILVKGSRMNRLERVVEALVHGSPTTTTTDGH